MTVRTIAALQALAAVVRDETTIGADTPTRVGGLLRDIVDTLDSLNAALLAEVAAVASLPVLVGDVRVTGTTVALTGAEAAVLSTNVNVDAGEVADVWFRVSASITVSGMSVGDLMVAAITWGGVNVGASMALPAVYTNTTGPALGVSGSWSVLINPNHSIPTAAAGNNALGLQAQVIGSSSGSCTFSQLVIEKFIGRPTTLTA